MMPEYPGFDENGNEETEADEERKIWRDANRREEAD
jgi:hypothetical protein